MLSLALCGPLVTEAEGFGVLSPLRRGDHRGSEATSRPPAAEGAGKLSQSFHSLAKGDKGTPPLSKCTSPRPLVSATGMDRTLVCNNTYCVCISCLARVFPTGRPRFPRVIHLACHSLSPKPHPPCHHRQRMVPIPKRQRWSITETRSELCPVRHSLPEVLTSRQGNLFRPVAGADRR